MTDKYEQALEEIIYYISHNNLSDAERSVLTLALKDLQELVNIYKLMGVEMKDQFDKHLVKCDKARLRNDVYMTGFYQGRTDTYRDMLDYWNKDFIKQNLENFMRIRGIN